MLQTSGHGLEDGNGVSAFQIVVLVWLVLLTIWCLLFRWGINHLVGLLIEAGVLTIEDEPEWTKGSRQRVPFAYKPPNESEARQRLIRQENPYDRFGRTAQEHDRLMKGDQDE